MKLTNLKIKEENKNIGPSNDDGTHYVDLVVSFFSILLILFVVNATKSYSKVSERSQLKYRTLDSELSSFKLRSFAPLYPYRSYWIIKDKMLLELDTSVLARLYMESASLHKVWRLKGARVEIAPMSNSATEYKINIELKEGKFPSEITRKKYYIKDNENHDDLTKHFIKQYKKEGKPFAFFIWKKTTKEARKFLERLSRNGVPYVISIATLEISIVRRSKSYGAENVLRPY